MSTESRKATVSLLMIVRNEEGQLADCLAPVAHLFDEIVIVDTGSQDATKEVARRFTDRVFDFPWCDDFSAARNECLRHATGEWVMWLDADDRLTPENIGRLQQLLSTLDSTPRAYLMSTACWTEFACEGHTLITHPRLFYRHPDIRWHGRVHEQIGSSSKQPLLEGCYCDVRIEHHGYIDRAVQQRKLQRNVRLLRMDYAVDPHHVSTLLHLGLSCFQLGLWEIAEKYFEQLVTAKPAADDHLRLVYGSLAQIAMKRGDVHLAMAAIERGLAVFADDEHLLYLYSECLYELDRYDEAAQTLLKICGGFLKPHYQGCTPGDIHSRLAPRKLADVLRLKRQFAAAERLLLQVLEKYPRDTHSWHLLGRIYIDCQERQRLLAVVSRLNGCPQGDIFGNLLLALWHINQRELAAAVPCVDWLIAQAPMMPLPRVLRVELLARLGAPLADRIHACHDVLRIQPGNIAVQQLLHSLETARPATASPLYGAAAVTTAASA